MCKNKLLPVLATFRWCGVDSADAGGGSVVYLVAVCYWCCWRCYFFLLPAGLSGKVCWLFCFAATKALGSVSYRTGGSCSSAAPVLALCMIDFEGGFGKLAVSSLASESTEGLILPAQLAVIRPLFSLSPAHFFSSNFDSLV